MENQVRLVGVLNVAAGVLSGLIAIFDLLFFGGDATLAGFCNVNTVLADVWLVAALVFMLPCIVIGIALIGFQAWARWAGIVLSILEMLVVPIGTIVGIYSLIVLFSRDVDLVFSGRFGSFYTGRR